MLAAPAAGTWELREPSSGQTQRAGYIRARRVVRATLARYPIGLAGAER
jgi:hypothetical protein